jgi:hypothetical protein
MKYFLLLLLIGFCGTSVAQLPSLTSEGKTHILRMVPNYQAKGYSDTASITVADELITDLKADKLFLFKIAMTANRKAVGTLKEQSSYRVGEKFNIWMVRNEIKCSWEYYGDNSYGAKKKNVVVATFDEKGTFKNSIVL